MPAYSYASPRPLDYYSGTEERQDARMIGDDRRSDAKDENMVSSICRCFRQRSMPCCT